MTPEFSICFVAHNAYGEMSDGSSGRKGGVERQTSLMARWLAKKGLCVSLVTWDEGQPDGIVVDGVAVYRVCREESGLPGLRFIHPKWTGLCGAMRRADAAVYYQNCGEVVTGQVALWARMRGRKFVFSVASDPECDPRLPQLPSARERLLYRYGLTRADRVIAQTRNQQRMLREGFGIESTVIPMPCPGPMDECFTAPRPLSEPGAHILWLARLSRAKRPDRLLDVAEACPELSFDMAGPVCSDDHSEGVLRRAQAMHNVNVHGPVPRARVPDFYRQAGCFLSTSDHEGFPNTFLEAWSHGLPIVSTFDPDGLIHSHGLGIVAQDVPGLVAGVRRLHGDPDFWRRCSANARRHYLENHQVDKVMHRFERVFREAIA